MVLSFKKRDSYATGSNVKASVRWRASARSRPQCESMESRRLLSTTSAPAAGFLSPGAAEVAKADSIVSSGAGQAFHNYTNELQQLEKSAHVTPGQFATLESDTEQLAQSIQQSIDLTSTAITDQLIQLQDTVDQSFLAASYTSTDWARVQTQLDDAVYGVTYSNGLPGDIYSQMQLIAREAHVTKTEYKTLTADEQAINAALGTNVDTSLGGTSPRDPLVVYYNGQVNQFVHKR